MEKKNPIPKLIIGTKDKVDFPLFDLYNIDCKIDTGADTSSIHCYRIKIMEENNQEFLSFKLLDPEHKNYNNKEFRVKEFAERQIKSSNGQTEYRYVITTKLVLFGQEFETEFTLADRESMRFPVLLGKKLLKGKFLVDVAKINLSFKAKKQALNSV
jgi:hypothetical protein